MECYLLDTNVISEFRKPRANQDVLAWSASVTQSSLHLDVLTLGEIGRGIKRVRQNDPVQARGYEASLATVRSEFSGRIMPITDPIADVWGTMGAIQPVAVVDGLLAATAIVEEMTLITRNVRHLRDRGATLVNPFNDQDMSTSSGSSGRLWREQRAKTSPHLHPS